MIAPHVIELMNLVIDGAASPKERAELEAALAAHPEIRAYYDSIARVAARLSADPMPEPPAQLEPRILIAVEQAGIRQPAPTAAPRKGFFSFSLRPWSTFGLGLAAGALIVAVIQYNRPGIWEAGRAVDPGNVSGSMVSEGWSPVGSIPVETKDGTVSGSASIYQQGPNMVVRVQLQSTVAIEWKVAFDGDAWALERVERQENATAAFAANRASVQGLHTGEGGVTLVFSGSPHAAQSVVFTILQGGQPVFEGHPSIVK